MSAYGSAVAADAAQDAEPEKVGPTMAEAEFAAQDSPPVEDAEPQTEVAAREEAQSLRVDSGDRGFAKPKVAALDYDNNNTAARRDHLAKFKFVILGARGGSNLSSFTAGIKARSPSTRSRTTPSSRR